jgi:hypothetical protein
MPVYLRQLKLIYIARDARLRGRDPVAGQLFDKLLLRRHPPRAYDLKYPLLPSPLHIRDYYAPSSQICIIYASKMHKVAQRFIRRQSFFRGFKTEGFYMLFWIQVF